MLSKMSLMDRYIIRELIPPFCLGITIFTVVGELIGISFEQVKFIVNDNLPFVLSFQVHYLKLAHFLSISLPFSCLLATKIIYTKLSSQHELIALQSCGVSCYRLIKPALIFSIAIAITMFAFHETIVPEANYNAALILEKHWQVDRNLLAKYNKQAVFYPEYTNRNQIKSIIVADFINGNWLNGVVILKFKDNKIREVIICQSALWDDLNNTWSLYNGNQNIIDRDGKYSQRNDFRQLSLNLPKNILEYAANNRDYREMNIIQLYRRLKIIEPAADEKKIRQLKINIQERYAIPFSCLVFTFFASVLNIRTEATGINNNSETIVIAIFAYYLIQSITITLAITGAISIICGVWLPNALGIGISYYFLLKRGL